MVLLNSNDTLNQLGIRAVQSLKFREALLDDAGKEIDFSIQEYNASLGTKKKAMSAAMADVEKKGEEPEVRGDVGVPSIPC